MVVQVKTDPVTRDKLGDDGLAEITESLWLKDCQTCGHSLADGPAVPALAVDDAGVFAVASLHYLDCRAPGWNDTGPFVAPPASMPTLSTASQAMVLSFAEHPGYEWAMVLTNPGLEAIAVERHDGTWQVNLDPYTAAGLAAGELTVGQPVPGATAMLGPDTITVTMTVPPMEIYTTSAGGLELALARRQGGLVWAGIVECSGLGRLGPLTITRYRPARVGDPVREKALRMIWVMSSPRVSLACALMETWPLVLDAAGTLYSAA